MFNNKWRIIYSQIIKPELKYVKKLYFETEEAYGKRIKRINPNENYTNSNIGCGFGKTISTDNGLSYVVIRKEVKQALLSSSKINSENKIVFTEDSFLPLKIILHEIGHSVDNNINRRVTNEIINVSNLRDAVQENIEMLNAEYYAEKFAVQKILEINNKYSLSYYKNEDAYKELEALRGNSTSFNNNKDLLISIIQLGIQGILYPLFQELGAFQACQNANSKTEIISSEYQELIDAIENKKEELFKLTYAILVKEIKI